MNNFNKREPVSSTPTADFYLVCHRLALRFPGLDREVLEMAAETAMQKKLETRSQDLKVVPLRAEDDPSVRVWRRL